MSASTSNQSNKIALQSISASSPYCPGQRIDSFVGWITYYIAIITFLLLLGASTVIIVESSQSSNTAALFTSSTRHPMNSRALFIASPSILKHTRFTNHRGFNLHDHVTTYNRPSSKAAIANCKLDHSKPHGYYTCSSTTTRLFHSNSNSDNNIKSSDSNNTKRSMSTNSYNENQQSSLTEQLATRLVQGSSSIPDTTTTTTLCNINKTIKACIAVAGGGSNAASSIVSIPGASSVLLESIVTYDRKSFAEFVTQNIVRDNDACGGCDEDWLMDLEDMSTASSSSDGNSNREGQSDVSHNDSTFHFCSTQASILLSKSALHRSLQLTTPSFTNHCLYCIGVGCTSSLVGKISTSSSNEGEETVNEDDVNEIQRTKRKSRAYIACSTLKDGTWVWEIELDNSDSSSNRNGRRTRSEE